jgi:beta-N-acetylhexosaminidase
MSPATRAAIVGIGGPTLLAEEAALFRAHPPAGVILFKRNVEDPSQLRRLIAAVRRLSPTLLLMVDQEGGRVARLGPPHWPGQPPAARIGRLFEQDRAAGLRAAYLSGALIGVECAAAGFDVVAAPVLDLAVPEAHQGVVGDRAFSQSPAAVARLGRASAAGLLAAGTQPVGKHAPGHGRARVDSHFELPIVQEGSLHGDVLPFALNADLPWVMTAHIVYTQWDSARPATLSERVIGGIIRGRMGFTGVVVSDDLAMGALTDAPAGRATAALAAGCDLALYCAGDLAATTDVLAAVPPLTDAARARLAAGRALAASRRLVLDKNAMAAERDRLLR